ncbi:MAG: pyruvate kinase [Syntrophobacteraceae bacterium]
MRAQSRFRRTKIVCTLGPKTSSPEMIRALIEHGMDVARLNFSHGDRDTHRQTIRAIRQASAELKKEVGILQDLGGPKIRLGTIAGNERVLEMREQVALVVGTESADPNVIPVNYAHLMEDVRQGDRIMMADGTVQLTVKEKNPEQLVCTVVVGGRIMSRKGINLPSSVLKVTALTEKDRQDLLVGLEEGIDFVAMSFVRSEKDLYPVLWMMEQAEKRPMLIAKIEKPQAVEGFNSILAEVDGVMVARGDLGVELPIEEVPIIQKQIIKATRQAGKPVITATQMLNSMQDNPRPTRAEATDVANAILDGTDALMLSDETAVGAYPLDAVDTLDRIAHTTEPYLDGQKLLHEEKSDHLPSTAAAISRAACLLAYDLHAAAIVACSSSGSTARLVTRFRPSCPTIALTDHVETLRQLSLSWGVIPYMVDSFSDTDTMFASARNWAIDQGIASRNDRLIITAGVPVGVPGSTNLVKVMELSGS